MSDKFGYSDTGRGNMLGQHRNFHVIKNLLREGFIKKKWEFLDLKLIGSSLGFEGELIWARLDWRSPDISLGWWLWWPVGL